MARRGLYSQPLRIDPERSLRIEWCIAAGMRPQRRQPGPERFGGISARFQRALVNDGLRKPQR